MIHTSIARIKAGPQWCVDADTLARKATEDITAEEPIDGALINKIGLANTLAVLGCPHPKCKKEAEDVLKAYNLELYLVIKALCYKLNVDFIDLTCVINNPRRDAQRLQLCRTLRHLQYTTFDPVLDYVFASLRALLSTESESTKAIYAGKKILTAWKLVESEYDLYSELVDNLTQLLGEHA